MSRSGPRTTYNEKEPNPRPGRVLRQESRPVFMPVSSAVGQARSETETPDMLLELNEAIMVAVVCVLAFVFIMLRFG